MGGTIMDIIWSKIGKWKRIWACWWFNCLYLDSSDSFLKRSIFKNSSFICFHMTHLLKILMIFLSWMISWFITCSLTSVPQVSAEYDETLRIELLQLATLLLKYLQTDLVQHRKELIKFGWNHLKREDSASKQWAFVNVCHFLEAYQAPEKIILQVFFFLENVYVI